MLPDIIIYRVIRKLSGSPNSINAPGEKLDSKIAAE
jgi:hypothetical protein